MGQFLSLLIAQSHISVCVRRAPGVLKKVKKVQHAGNVRCVDLTIARPERVPDVLLMHEKRVVDKSIAFVTSPRRVWNVLEACSGRAKRACDAL